MEEVVGGKMVGTRIKCKKCGAKIRVIWGLKTREVSEILGEDCGYRLIDRDNPSPRMNNIVCSKCGSQEFEALSLLERLRLKREWMKWLKNLGRKS